MEAATDTHDQVAAPDLVPVAERLQRLPEALLLTAGYYASRIPALGELIRRLD